ncbi:MAG TPA: PAS domain S-box protein, partial [Opitutus sp.]|nr:PAS domain S-box protein [Opitutus sp.]
TSEPPVSAPASIAENYLPIVYRLPPFSEPSRMGFNMYSAVRSTKLVEAQKTGATLMSQRGRLFNRADWTLGFILFVPVFETVAGSAADRGSFRGMLQGVFQLDRFLFAVFADQTSRPPHELLIEDPENSSGDTSLGIIDATGNVILEDEPDRTRFSEPGVVRRKINLWGRNLELVFRPTAPLGREGLVRPGIDLISGLLVSSALGFLAFSLARRSTLVEQQVNLRTQELKAIQLKLENDIARRVEAESRLRVSEQRYRSLFDQNPDAVYSSDLNGNFVSANQGMEKITGYSVAEIVGMPCAQVIAPESWDSAKSNISRAAAGHSVNFELVGLRKDGGRFHVNLTQLPILVDGKIVGIYGIAKDVAAVRRVTRELESFFDLSAEVMAISKSDGHCRRVNRAFEKLTGFHDGELTSSPMYEFIHPDDRASTKAEIDKLFHDRTTIAIENRVRTKTGGYRLLAWSIRSVPMEGILYAVAHDVTDQRQTELRIREQASLLDKAQDAILVYDLDHRISYWNKSAERLYGWTSREACERDVRDLIYRDHREAFEVAHTTLLDAGEWTGELKQTSRDGRAILGETRWTLVHNAVGSACSVLSITTDVTEQKNVEAQLLRV